MIHVPDPNILYCMYLSIQILHFTMNIWVSSSFCTRFMDRYSIFILSFIHFLSMRVILFLNTWTSSVIDIGFLAIIFFLSFGNAAADLTWPAAWLSLHTSEFEPRICFQVRGSQTEVIPLNHYPWGTLDHHHATQLLSEVPYDEFI